jgi:hypothetical protein
MPFMRNQSVTIRIILLAGAALLLFNPILYAQQSVIRSQAAHFLDAYVSGDQNKVLKMVDPGITMYGSDRNEVLHGTKELSELMRLDQLLWQKTARITDLCNFSEVSTGSLATLFFDATFTVGNRPPLPRQFDVIVLGAGAAGLMCAAVAGSAGGGWPCSNTTGSRGGRF